MKPSFSSNNTNINLTPISTTKFYYVNFNLKRIIFSYLKTDHQRKIYWLNKKLRHLLPESSYKINIKSLKIKSRYTNIFESDIGYILELNNGNFAFWSKCKIYLIRINNQNQSLEIIREYPCKTSCFYTSLSPIELYDSQNESHNCIILSDGNKELRLWDRDFNLVQTFKQEEIVYSLCSISLSKCLLEPARSFALGIDLGIIKIYSRKNIQEFELYKVYQSHTLGINCLLFVRKYDLLFSGAYDETINVYDLMEDKNLCKLTEHKTFICGIIYFEDMLASISQDGEIKIWTINQESNEILIDNKNFDFVCINTIKAYDYDVDQWIYLNHIGIDFMISYQDYSNEFKIWDLKTLECVKDFKDSKIKYLNITKNKCIIISTWDNKINIWGILE